MTTDPRVVPIESYPARLAEIAAEAPHTIRILPAPLDEPQTEFNCVMHALELVGRIEDPYGRPFSCWYADTAFLRSLIDRGVLQPSAPRPEAVVTWSSAEGLRHVGVLVAPDRAASKWGVSYVFEHGLLEVPANYGNQLAFYSPLEPDDALDHLKTFYRVTCHPRYGEHRTKWLEIAPEHSNT
jgi:hypothetical protein